MNPSSWNPAEIKYSGNKSENGENQSRMFALALKHIRARNRVRMKKGQNSCGSLSLAAVILTSAPYRLPIFNFLNDFGRIRILMNSGSKV
jgi:hypothetical protein